MARRCIITGTQPLVGNKVSHANNKTKRRQYPNLKKRRIFIKELGRFETLKLSTRAIKTLDKIGLQAMLKKHSLKVKDILNRTARSKLVG